MVSSCHTLRRSDGGMAVQQDVWLYGATDFIRVLARPHNGRGTGIVRPNFPGILWQHLCVGAGNTPGGRQRRHDMHYCLSTSKAAPSEWAAASRSSGFGTSWRWLSGRLILTLRVLN
jgi:hypothetical protein